MRMKICVLALGLSVGWCALAGPQDVGPVLPSAEEPSGLLARIGSGLDSASQQVGQSASGLVVTALGFLGVPYRRGGSDAETGFDCSGFVRAMYERTVGQLLPRKASEQAAATERIDKTDLQPGDLVFFNTMRRAFSHVGIYVGDNKFVHAPKPGAKVRVEDMTQAYWAKRFDGARRVNTPVATARAGEAGNKP